ncbi:hypothetical protein [Sulfurimonas sp.]
MAAELRVAGIKQNEKVEKLFNENILFDKLDKCSAELDECKQKIKELQEDRINVDTEQLRRITKLQAIGALNDDLSEAVKDLIDSYIEVQADRIKESVLKI